MSLALLFPGQGSQHPGMLSWLDGHPLAQATLAQMAVHIGADWRVRLNDERWATRNAIAQPLLTGVCLAAWQALQLPAADVVAGYSVGELAAFGAAGVFDAQEALRLAVRRAELMDRCAAATVSEGALLSSSGVPVPLIDALCERFGLAVAIRIDPQRCVLGGARDALDAALQVLTEAGADSIWMPVRVASHTPLMRDAAQAFAQLIAPLPWRRPSAVIVSNFDGSGTRQPEALKQALAGQIASTVQWERCLNTLAERQPRCVLELGPGTGLSRLWAARHPDVPVRSVSEFLSAQAVSTWVRGVLRP